MANDEIYITVSNKSQNVGVGVAGGNNKIGITGDNSQYFSNEARKSAEQAKLSATEAQGYAEQAEALEANIDTVVANATTEINAVKDSILQDESIVVIKDNLGNITTAAVNIEDINIAAENIEDIKDASLLANEFVEIWEAGVANNNFSNLTEQGEKHFLNKSQITNCLLEVPQRIKLELNAGVLTLKAGSEVIVPNGFEADGVTRKFDYVTVESDVSLPSYNGTYTETYVFVVENNTLDSANAITRVYNGASAPSYSGQGIWYNATDNLCKLSKDSGGTWLKCSLPIGISSITSNVRASIDQVFNGFGYIGSTVWVDKGVKGLFADGENADGTYRNIEFTNSELAITNLEGQDSIYGRISIYNNHIHLFGFGVSQVFEQETKPNISGLYGLWYDTSRNLVLSTDDGGATWTKTSNIIIPKLTKASNGNITELKIKQPFRAIDYSDKSTISAWGMPSNKYIGLSLGASGSTYTAPANGWMYFSMRSGGFEYVELYNITNEFNSAQAIVNANWQLRCNLPVRKGDVVRINYNATGGSPLLRFYYAEGEV